MGGIEYRREMNRNYMVIKPELERNESYMIRMLNRNRISGLLVFQEKQVDGESKFYYDITSRQPLNRILENRGLAAKEIYGLVSDLLFTLRQMERFLLDEGQLSLKPEHIYVEPDVFRGNFCLIPGKHGDFATEFRELAQYLLDHVNHSDGEAVVLAFSIFRECRNENFGIDDIENSLRNNTEKIESAGEIYENREGKFTEKVEDAKSVIEEEVPSEKIWDMMQDRTLNFQTDETQGGIGRKIAIVGIVTGMVLIPVSLCALFGVDRILSWSKIIFVLGIVAVALLAIILKTDGNLNIEKYDSTEEKNQNLGMEEEELWKVYFRENDDYEERDEKGYMEEDDIQTVLLTTSPKDSDMRSLIPINGGTEISIGYYPFLIGKNRELSDYCLNEEGVSRLHVKIEKTNDGYSVTDLNSTNGTKVNGELLEANETKALFPGNELTIAAVKYRFR